MTLVTVACFRDFHQILIQAESIGLFLEPCTHYIIVNEEKVDLDFWYRWLSPYYKNHELKIIPRIVYDYTSVYAMLKHVNHTTFGWRSQQLQKLLISRIIDDDYLVLDAKTFFVRHGSISAWDNSLGSGPSYAINEQFINTNYAYSIALKKEILTIAPHSVTPFKIITEPLRRYLETANNHHNLYKFLFLPEIYPFKGSTSPSSEFLFYCYIANDYFKEQDKRTVPNNHIIWDAINDSQFNKILSNQPLTLNIHRNFLNKCDVHMLENVNKYLSDLGFKNKLYPYPDSHDTFFSS